MSVANLRILPDVTPDASGLIAIDSGLAPVSDLALFKCPISLRSPLIRSPYKFMNTRSLSWREVGANINRYAKVRRSAQERHKSRLYTGRDGDESTGFKWFGLR
jgi:hypothetical protein